MNKNKKTVLFVCPSLEGAGAERILVLLLKNLDRTRFAPHLALFQKKGEYLNLVPRDVPTYDLRKRSPFDFLKLIVVLVTRIYPLVKPDIVVTFLEYASIVVLLSNLFSIIKFQSVITIHSFVTLFISRQRFPGIKRNLVFLLYRNAQRVICVSKGLVSDLLMNYRIKPDRINVIYNGIDIDSIVSLSSINASDEHFESGVPVVMSCGRLAEMKNYALLFESFSILIKKISVRLIIIGVGGLKNQLIQLASRLGISSHVFFIGFKENPFQYMRRSDVFVLPSKYEPFGLVIIEAMACGVPVVATDCPSGPGEIIEHGINGLLVQPDNPNELALAMEAVLTSPGLKEKLSIAGRERVLEFSDVKMTREYERVFDEI